MPESNDFIVLLENSFAHRWIISKEQRPDGLFLELPKEYIARFISFLKEDKKAAFTMLTSITAIDFPFENARFSIIYHLFSATLNLRLSIKIVTRKNSPVPSLSEIFPSASGYEREIWDMFGIMFSENLNLCRILNERDFAWFPLQKTFPLEGFVHLKWNEEKSKCLHFLLKEEC